MGSERFDCGAASPGASLELARHICSGLHLSSEDPWFIQITLELPYKITQAGPSHFPGDPFIVERRLKYMISVPDCHQSL